MLKKENYRENSNVLCYYVFPAALMNNYRGFLNWCQHQQNFIKFDNTINNVDAFTNFILENYYSPQFLANLKLVEKINLGNFKNSLQMSII